MRRKLKMNTKSSRVGENRRRKSQRPRKIESGSGPLLSFSAKLSVLHRGRPWQKALESPASTSLPRGPNKS